MKYGRAINAGGSIYTTGSGVSSITFQNCADIVSYFETENNGGFMYFNNPDSTFSSTNCDYDNMLALLKGGFVYGNDMGTFGLT